MSGYVYVLEFKNGRFYVGSTNDIIRRYEQHEAGVVLATKYVRPTKLVGLKEFATLQEARKCEYNLKRQKSRKVIEVFVHENVLGQ